MPRPRINWASFAIGMAMAALGFVFQWFCNAWSYPLNVGGRPAFAIPAFIPITFESGVLFASFSSFFGRLHHLRAAAPLPPAVRRARASSAPPHDRYFLAVGSEDPRFDAQETRGGSRAPGLRCGCRASEVWREVVMAAPLAGTRLAAASACEGLLPEPDFERMINQDKAQPYEAQPLFARRPGDADAAGGDGGVTRRAPSGSGRPLTATSRPASAPTGTSWRRCRCR